MAASNQWLEKSGERRECNMPSNLQKQSPVISLSYAADSRKSNFQHWKWQLSNSNIYLKWILSNLFSPQFLSSVFALFEDGSNLTLPSSWEHSVTWMFHPGFHSWKEWHVNWVVPVKWHQPGLCRKPGIILGHFCFSLDGKLCHCPGWERRDATHCCDY